MFRKVTFWINALLGLWIAASPFALNYRETEPAFYNALAAGLAVAIVALAGWLFGENVIRWGRAKQHERPASATQTLRAA